MKLAKVEHDRCNEYAATTYVWVADDMTEEHLYALVEAARRSYLQAEEDFKIDAPKNPGYVPNYKVYPNNSVKEVEDMFNIERLAYKKWEEKRALAREPFVFHLIKASNGLAKSFYDMPDALTVNCSWGHRHGTTIKFGGTYPEKKDLNYPKEEEHRFDPEEEK